MCQCHRDRLGALCGAGSPWHRPLLLLLLLGVAAGRVHARLGRGGQDAGLGGAAPQAALGAQPGLRPVGKQRKNPTGTQHPSVGRAECSAQGEGCPVSPPDSVVGRSVGVVLPLPHGHAAHAGAGGAVVRVTHATVGALP